jgi:hypothetical protein
MAAARIPVIAARHLNSVEHEKLERLDAKLTSTFVFAGYSDVRVCEGTGDGEDRQIIFRRGIIGSALVTVTALEFLTLSGRQLSELILKRLAASREPSSVSQKP